MTDHIAIVTSPLDEMILDGRKLIESRFTQTARPPFGCAAPGDRIFFKRSGGPFFAAATLARVLMVDQVTPAMVDQLVTQYNRWIRGPDEYWRSKRLTTRYVTLMWLRDVKQISQGPRYQPENMRAWYVLDGEADSPVDGFTVTLTAGALRQNYVRPPAAALADCPDQLELHLHAGPTITTDLHRGMFRWCGWGQWFAQHHLRSGQRLQFTPHPGRPGAFDVRPVKETGVRSQKSE
ncbi:MAG: hypothetical protein WC058_08130 [Phycisphaeraceae bacterium]